MYPSLDDKSRVQRRTHEIARSIRQEAVQKMSKSNKHNRFANRANAEDKTAPSVVPVIVDDIDDDKKTSYFGDYCGKIATYCVACSKAAVSKTWTCCQIAAQWTWSGICKIPSYCVIRWEEEEEETESPAAPPTVSPKPDAIKVAPIKAVATPVKIGVLFIYTSEINILTYTKNITARTVSSQALPAREKARCFRHIYSRLLLHITRMKFLLY